MFDLVLELAGRARLRRPCATRVKGVSAVFRDVSARWADGVLVLEGVLEADICYVGTDGRLHSRRCETAFVQSYPAEPLAAAAGWAGDGEARAVLSPREAVFQLQRLPGRAWGEEVRYTVRAHCRFEKPHAVRDGAAAPGPRLMTRLLKVEEVVGAAVREAMAERAVGLTPVLWTV